MQTSSKYFTTAAFTLLMQAICLTHCKANNSQTIELICCLTKKTLQSCRSIETRLNIRFFLDHANIIYNLPQQYCNIKNNKPLKKLNLT